MTQYRVSPRIKGFARSMRRNDTPHEAALWDLLRDRRFLASGFGGRSRSGPFIADFVCYGRWLIVELDGSQHADDPGDVGRDAELRRRGFRILHVWNSDLTGNRNGVMEAILAALRADGPADERGV